MTNISKAEPITQQIMMMILFYGADVELWEDEKGFRHYYSL